MPTVTKNPILSSETLDRSNWYYIPGQTQDHTDTTFQPRNSFGDVDGETENLITFWNSGSTTEKMLSYQNALEGNVTITFKIMRGGGGSSQPTYNVKLANNSISQVFHLSSYDWNPSGTVTIQKSSTGYTKTDSWTTEHTITKTDISNTGWTTITQTINLSNEYLAIRQPTTDNAGGWVITDIEISYNVSSSVDRTPEVMRGFMLPYPVNVNSMLWDSESSFTEQNPRAGIAESNQEGMNILTSGTMETNPLITIETARAGGVNLESGKGASFYWRETGDVTNYGYDVPVTIQGYEQILESNTLTKDYNYPNAVFTVNGNLIIATAEKAVSPFGLTLTTIQGSSTHTTDINVDTSLPTIDYYPALTNLSNGNVLLAFWKSFNSTDTCQVITYISRDEGITWAKSNDEALDISIDISTATGFTPKRLFLASNENQVLLIGRAQKNAAATNREGIIQAASSNMAASFKVLSSGYTGTTNLVPIGLFVQDEKFRLATIRNSNSCVLYDIEHAFINVSYIGAFIDTTIYSDDIDIAVFSSGLMTQGEEAHCFKDENNHIYAIFSDTGNNDSKFMRLSTDGNTFSYTHGKVLFSDVVYMYDSTSTTTNLDYMTGISYHGKNILICNIKSSTTTYDDSVYFIHLGGYTNITLPGTTTVQAPINDTLGYYNSWLPFDPPGTASTFSKTGAGTETIDDGKMRINSNVEYSVSPTSTLTEGYLIRTVLQPIGNQGATTSLERGIKLRLLDVSNMYIVQLRISKNTLIVRDVNGSTDMGTYAFGNNVKIEIIISMRGSSIFVYVNKHGSPSKAKRFDLVNESDTTITSASPTGSNEIAWGQFVTDALMNTDFFEFHYTSGSEYSNMLTSSSDFLGRTFSPFGTYIYINDDLKICTQDTPTYQSDTWDIERTADYPIEKIFFQESSSMVTYWRSQAVSSGSVAENFIAIKLDEGFTTGTNQSIGSDIICFHLEGINFKNFNIEYYNSSTSSWVILKTVDSTEGLTGSFTRENSMVIPGGTSSNPFWMNFNEFVGCIAELDDGAGNVVQREIEFNTSGTFSNVDSKRPEIKLINATSSDPSSGTLRILPKKISIVCSLNGIKAIAWAIRITAQETKDKYFTISNFSFGQVFVFSPQYGRGRSITFEPNVEIFQSEDGTMKPKKKGNAKRIIRVSWADGIDTNFLYNDIENLDYFISSSTSGSQAISTWSDIPISMKGIYDYVAGEKPIVYLPYIIKSTSSSTDIRIINTDEKHLLGLIDGNLTYDNILGDESENEVLRVASVIIREIV
ncbi:MAG: hypothetical protein CMD97_05830 [Gammaproteobacteria bacterium]|nr:hypothetical protein [Gammaproteobacteria bacterium]|tara:strand:- start:51 stop:3878 length:3828 start_codon:yes stop_codon:yes gene_type:complete